MNLPGKRLLLGTAVAAAALGVGGFAYAAGNDPAGDQGYVTVEEGPASDGKDCPDKAGGTQGAQPQNQPEQGRPEAEQPDVSGNA